jgi:hypothetical protein
VSAADRFSIVSEGPFQIYVRGDIRDGDFEQLPKIHAMPVPITNIHISSAGGSVKEALRIAKYVYENHVHVKSPLALSQVSVERSSLRIRCTASWANPSRR